MCIEIRFARTCEASTSSKTQERRERESERKREREEENCSRKSVLRIFIYLTVILFCLPGARLKTIETLLFLYNIINRRCLPYLFFFRNALVSSARNRPMRERERERDEKKKLLWNIYDSRARVLFFFFFFHLGSYLGARTHV